MARCVRIRQWHGGHSPCPVSEHSHISSSLSVGALVVSGRWLGVEGSLVFQSSIHSPGAGHSRQACIHSRQTKDCGALVWLRSMQCPLTRSELVDRRLDHDEFTESARVLQSKVIGIFHFLDCFAACTLWSRLVRSSVEFWADRRRCRFLLRREYDRLVCSDGCAVARASLPLLASVSVASEWRRALLTFTRCK